MSSTLYAKLRARKGEFEIFVVDDQHLESRESVSEHMTVLRGKEIELNLHFKTRTVFAITGKWPGEVTGDVPEFYTVTCVADWMWFLLSLHRYYKNSVEIVECRPDPFDILVVVS